MQNLCNNFFSYLRSVIIRVPLSYGCQIIQSTVFPTYTIYFHDATRLCLSLIHI